MAKKDGDFSQISYVLGVISVVMAFFVPISGAVLGIVGIVHSKNQKTELSKRAKNLSIAGIIISIVMLVVNAIITAYLGPNLGII